MSIEDTIGYRQNVPACAVCGKNVQGRGGFARVNRNGHLIELCCRFGLKHSRMTPIPTCAVSNEQITSVIKA